MKYTVYMCRTWEERFKITVKASSLEKATAKACVEAREKGFDWSDVDSCDTKLMYVDDENGNCLFDHDAETHNLSTQSLSI